MKNDDTPGGLRRPKYWIEVHSDGCHDVMAEDGLVAEVEWKPRRKAWKVIGIGFRSFYLQGVKVHEDDTGLDAAALCDAIDAAIASKSNDAAIADLLKKPSI